MDAEQADNTSQSLQSEDGYIGSDTTPLLSTNSQAGYTVLGEQDDRDAPRARLLALWSVILGISIISAYEAMTLVDLSDLIAIYNTVFFPVAILGWLVSGERFTVKMAFAACESYICLLVPQRLSDTI